MKIINICKEKKQTQIQKILHKITNNLAMAVNIKYANGFTKCIFVIIEGGDKEGAYNTPTRIQIPK